VATRRDIYSTFTRRRFLRACGAAALGSVVGPRILRAEPETGFTGSPFSLGVASGYPSPNGVVLWTRLAPEPLTPGGGMEPTPVDVRWEVARDERFTEIAMRGTAQATPEWGHSVHVDARGLAPDRWYWFRFHAAGATSPVGRTRTAPAADAAIARMRIAVASCQHYEHGWYAAYRHMLADSLDLVVHVGDYIYESSFGGHRVRSHEAGEPYSLEDYRARYACYRSDPDLRAAHASYPWVSVWDDHEVENDYANDRSQNDEDPASFLARRAAAYQAYYEHMPLPSSMAPAGPSMRIYTRLPLGRLAEIFLLDDRQYRTDQPCPASGERGARLIGNCQERLDPHATLLGVEQERWLSTSLESSTARWKLLAQQTLMAQADALAGPGQRFYSDGWDGYPAARKRLLGHIASRKIRNPVVLSGDVHSFWANDLAVDFDDAKSPTIASELVTTSISSQPPPEERIQTAKTENPRIHFATGTRRGYLRLEITPVRLRADLRAVDDVTDPSSACTTMASFVVEDGRPGPRRA
jgi:alkaline phosphatase D